MTNRQRKKLREILFNHHCMTFDDFKKKDGFLATYFDDLCEYIDESLKV